MRTEKGVIIVAYKRSNGGRRYAILKRTKNWEGWELPKGHLEKDDYRETVKIELNEEAGVSEENIKNIDDLGETVTWSYEEDGEKIKREYKGFSVELKSDVQIETSNNPSDEHETGFFLGFEDAKSLLTFENNKDLLERFHNNI